MNKVQFESETTFAQVLWLLSFHAGRASQTFTRNDSSFVLKVEEKMETKMFQVLVRMWGTRLVSLRSV